MAKNDKPSLSSTPTYQQDPQYRQAISDLMKYGNGLASGNFTGDLAWLKNTTEVNPEMINTFASTLTGSLMPQFRNSNQDLINTLAETGGLGASTASNKLGQNYADFMNSISSQTGAFNINQTANAIQNKITLEQMGLGAIGQGANYGSVNEGRLNEFNLQNYENQVAGQLYQDQSKGGGWGGAFSGGLGGAMGGATTGAMIGSIFPGIGTGIGALAGGLIGGIGGGASGYFSPSSTGNALLQGGLFSAGRQYGAYGNTGNFAGSSASNNLFRDTSSSLSTKYPYLMGGIAG